MHLKTSHFVAIVIVAMPAADVFADAFANADMTKSMKSTVSQGSEM
jgi:hypothetical protein